jgi:FkbM family methyltransferase
MRLFIELAARSRCFVDIGANIGYYSVVAALVNPDLRVYAFEPAPSIFHYLEKNIQLNGFEDRIRAFPIALAEGAGEIDLFITRNPKAEYLEHHLGGSSNTVRPRDARSRTVKVATSGLDDFADQYELPDIDLLKMDTEGTEDRVLAGAQAVIERGRPVIFCEVLPGRIEDRLERFCEAHEYVHYLPTVAGLKPVDSLRGHGVAKDFVLVPRGKVSLMAPFVDDDDDRSDGMHASTRQTP